MFPSHPSQRERAALQGKESWQLCLTLLPHMVNAETSLPWGLHQVYHGISVAGQQSKRAFSPLDGLSRIATAGPSQPKPSCLEPQALTLVL